MKKQIGFVIMLVALVFIFSGYAVAPLWFTDSTLGQMLFTLLVILIIIGIIMMVK